MRFIKHGLRTFLADDGAGSAPLARRQTGAAGRKWRWGSGPAARETFNGIKVIDLATEEPLPLAQEK